MIAMTLAEVAEVAGGQVHDAAGVVTVTGPAFVDSRVVELGGLFAAFAGQRVDGHAYAAAAVEAGAAAVLCSRPVGVPSVVVPDVLTALGRLARHVLRRLGRPDRPDRPGLTVIGVTGSQGKTSTKDLLARVLSDAAPTVATYGSFNNELGLPLTVLRADATTRYLLLEMGARGVGHVRALCEVAPPAVALVLNVGKAHLGEFGSQAEIARAKGELVEALPAEGVAVLNADDPLVAAMASRTTARVLTFGAGPDADVRLAGVRLDGAGRPELLLEHEGAAATVALRLVGEHQAHNAAAAAAVALAVGIGLDQAARSLAAVEQVSKWRMEVREAPSGVTVVNDSYNANPDSMRAALKALAAIGRSRSRTSAETRTVAVLGEMRELGESSREEHDAVGRLAVRLDISRLLVVGEAARAIHLGAYLEGSWGEESVFVPDNAAAVGWLRDHLRPGDVVLVKASRAARLDEVADALLAPAPGPPGGRR